MKDTVFLSIYFESSFGQICCEVLEFNSKSDALAALDKIQQGNYEQEDLVELYVGDYREYDFVCHDNSEIGVIFAYAVTNNKSSYDAEFSCDLGFFDGDISAMLKAIELIDATCDVLARKLSSRLARICIDDR